MNNDTESKRYTITAALPLYGRTDSWPFGVYDTFGYLFRYLRLREETFCLFAEVTNTTWRFDESQKKKAYATGSNR
jgi:hypothetical protein